MIVVKRALVEKMKRAMAKNLAPISRQSYSTHLGGGKGKVTSDWNNHGSTSTKMDPFCVNIAQDKDALLMAIKEQEKERLEYQAKEEN